MSRWDGGLRIDHRGVRLLIADELGHDVLKAHLPLRCDHPRAMLTLLEGVALYSGSCLRVATSVAGSVGHSPASALLGGDLFPADSALVRLDFSFPTTRRRRIRGLGDFCDVRRLGGRGGS